MKKSRRYYFVIVALLIIALLPVSCIKDNFPTGEKASVTMTFTTRVSDNVTTGDLLDNEQMKTLRVIVARAGTNDIIYNVSYDIKPNETQKTIRFSELTVKEEGEEFDFYAIANEQAFLSGGESLEGKNVKLDVLKARILTKDFNNPALSMIPQAAFKTIMVEPNDQNKASMKLLFPLVKVVLNFNNQTEETVFLTDVKIERNAGRGFLFKAINAGYPDDAVGMATVKFGTEGALTVPVGDITEMAPYVRYLYPWEHTDNWKLTATWGSKPHEVVFKVNDEILKKLEAGKQLNVNITLIANSLKVSLTVSDWRVDDAILDFSTEFQGLLNPASEGSVKLTANKGAVAVATDKDGTKREATFSFKMFSPEGVKWTAHLESTSDFELTGTTSGSGEKDAAEVIFGVKPKFEHVATDIKSVKLYITVQQPFGETVDNGIQVINPKEENIYRFPGTETEILIQQVSEAEFDELTESVSIKQ